MQKDQFEIKTLSGIVFKGRQWLLHDAQANLVFLTGMMEHSGRYDNFGRYLNQRGINLFVMDQLGQGLNVEQISDLQKWPQNAFQLSLEAIECVRIMASENGLPTAMGGHSMGSIMMQAYLENYVHPNLKAIIMGTMAGPAIMQEVAYGLSRLLVRPSRRDLAHPILNYLGTEGFKRSIKGYKTPFDWLSYNEANVQAYLQDDFCGAKNTGGFWQEFLRGTKDIWRSANLKRIDPSTQLLLVSGQDDPVGGCGKGVKWLEARLRKYGIHQVETILYPRMRHEILNEEGHRQVEEDIVDFIFR
ncbi:alpha/beta fold hydrolase [Vaginisenegalia massiliensis]|uniref:alpha/beta fold hydrolase n=1 Tax=Vaginisenegalia massiliensis TaxID=2058294 RepID=UPI000F541241|nr:alpha/beta fold hydrolase [Vaginisenegalia massiliensis]